MAPDLPANTDAKVSVDAGMVATMLEMDASRGLDAARLDPSSIRPDGAICLALGCDELGYECGETVDNCGDPLNCNLASNATPCAAPNRCGGDPGLGPQRCGCKPRADACAAQGAECGAIDECGNAVDCGSCSNGSVCLSNSCACTADSDPCGTKVCGSVVDGCGKVVKCGPSAGACGIGQCDVTGQCQCAPRAQVCVGKTGAVMQDGCAYDCAGGSSTCVPDNAAACAGAECGTARNNCGDTVTCGASAGVCPPGNTCIGSLYVLDALLPARTASYQGGYCVADGAAQMLGKYVARTHGFQQAGTSSINFVNRAETVSFVTIQYSRTRAKAQLTEIGCVATTIGDPATLSGGGTRSYIENYRNLDAVVVDLDITGSTFTRPQVSNAVLGAGSPAGWAPGIPSYCVGHEGQDVDLPAADTRRGKWWPDNRCTCPTSATALPIKAGSADPNNYSTTMLRDCRIIDDDKDGKAGFTAHASALGIINSDVYNAIVSHSTWAGVIRPDRYHVGYGGEPVTPVERVVLGCAATGGACAAPGVDCLCSDRWSTVQMVPLADTAPMDCTSFYTGVGTAGEAVNQTTIDQQFSVGFGSCTAAHQCPSGSICRANKCFSQTSKGACTSGSTNPCPAGTFCEGCPDDPGSTEVETTCRSDATCWPTTAECPPMGGTMGGYCKATP